VDKKSLLEQINCNLCGGATTRPEMQKHGYDIVRCASCGLVYVNPRMPAATLAGAVYGPGYFDAEKGYGLEDHFSAANRERSVKSGAERLKWIEKHKGKGRLLDVGCAGGFFMLAAKQRGWTPRGFEISEHAAAYARDKLGFDVTVGDFSALEPEPATFDLITMLDVIEHLPDPMQGLRNAAATLAPGGALFIATPNFAGLPARAQGANWGLIEPEHHLYYFTPDTLGKMLEKAGFEIVEWRFPLLGLNDLLLSAGALQKAGIKVTEEQKSTVRKRFRAPRAAARALLSAADSNIFAPLFARNRGVIIEVIAKRL
jgi:SAM-dependent methyltransferase